MWIDLPADPLAGLIAKQALEYLADVWWLFLYEEFMSHVVRMLLVSLCWAVAGCVSVSVNGRYYTHRSGETAIDTTRLKLDGYYWSIQDSAYQRIQPIMLWPDGTATMMAGMSGAILDERGELHPTGNFEDSHAAVEKNLHSLDRDEPSGIRWGAFRVFGDSISIQVMTNVASGSVFTRDYQTVEYNGSIINDQSFRLTNAKLRGARIDAFEPETYHYRKLSEMPPSTNWTQTHPSLR